MINRISVLWFFLSGWTVLTAAPLIAHEAEQIEEEVTPLIYPLPPYVTVKTTDLALVPPILKEPTHVLSFPLSKTDKYDVALLTQKFEREKNCAGLSAPQIGIGKSIIIFAVPNDPNLKKWRPDLTESIAQTILINPHYEGIEEEGMNRDYEACFSVEDVAGVVPRYKTIRYSGYTPAGKKVEGVARGFLARVIQHEVDHVQGLLFTTKADPGSLQTIQEYRVQRAAAMGQEDLKKD